MKAKKVQKEAVRVIDSEPAGNSPLSGDLIGKTDDHEAEDENEKLPLVDELGVEDLDEVLFGGRGRLFSAAGRESPVAEITGEGVLLHPPQKPFAEEGDTENIISQIDERGILLNELGQLRKIVGARYKGFSIYALGEMKPGTLKHYAAWFDEEGQMHKLYVQGEALTTDMIFRIRNRTHDGEIGSFAEITSD